MMGRAADLETAIVQELIRRGPCSFDELTRSLPTYSWNQLFLTVDRLSREGRLRLRHPGRVGVHLSLAGQEQASTALSQANSKWNVAS
jgi:hypothetical protein